MSRQAWFAFFILIASLVSASCNLNPTPEANMPNPASVHCEQNGGQVELRQDASGGVAGVCVFPDGSECDEWAFFRGECKPGAKPEPTPTTAGIANDGWQVYQNEKLGYSFRYPADATINTDDSLKTVSITGLLANNEYWPQIEISHPNDREDFHPPENVDLAQWLADHNLTDEKRLPDTRIAGTIAIHFRHERSPQSYAHDRYYFAGSGQLYVITIGHVGDKEDWGLYNRFLASIQFTR